MEDFDTLCDVVDNHSVEELAMSFVMMHSAKDVYDDYVLDGTNVISFTIATEEVIKISKTSIMFPALAHLGSTAHWDWVAEAKAHIHEYAQIYNMLSDSFSQDALRRIMLSRFLLDAAYFTPVYELEYYDWRFLTKRESAVFVDCGAYNGDSVLSFIKHYGEDYKHIYAYEPTPNTFAQLSKATAAFRRITARNCAAGEYEGNIHFHLNISHGETGNYIHHDNTGGNGGDISIPVISLDNEITEPVSFIKMDIEGSEIDALRGAKCHIVNDKPQLAISAYHTFKDLRRIPLLVYSYNKNQRFYFRNHQWGGEMVFYADPY
jgi:FkbM family methyltransferase